jgi:hypothetical protein
MAAEKRWSPRNAFLRKVQVVPHTVPFARLVTEEKPQVCWSQNIGKGGMCLETSKPFNRDLVVKLNFQYMEKKPMNVFAKVIWARANQCGLKFMAFGDSQRR